MTKINRVLGIEVPEKEVDHIFERLGYTYTKKDKVYDVTIPNRAMDVKITGGSYQKRSAEFMVMIN